MHLAKCPGVFGAWPEISEGRARLGGNGAPNGRVGSRVSDLVSDKRNTFRGLQGGCWKVRQNRESQ